MSSELAERLCEHLCQYFLPEIENSQKSQLQNALRFHLRFLPTSGHEDFEPLLFVEFQNEAAKSTLTVSDAITIISRVQKRIYRELNQRSPSIQSYRDSIASPAHLPFDRVVTRFIDYLKRTTDTEDAILFQLYFLDRKGVAAISQELGVGKSSVYERIKSIKAHFKTFLDDVDFPGVS